MLVLAVGLSTPLAAQSSLLFGLAATLGGGWQIEGTDLGLVRHVRAGPLRFASLNARLGSFVDEGAIFGGVRGFVAGLAVGGRTALVRIAQLGYEQNPTDLGVDLTLEATGYLASRTPLPQGSSWAAVSILPGLRFGDADGVRYSLVVGPTVFFGQATNVHPFLGVRFEVPLARRERHP